ncbi:MAG: GNAT family N-acetyltransferase [Devosia sp.]|uniref:GNAT family N-acetyltransferase n=1 Tax=Devosia sp. TaxID=1871048 RepID=UPI0024C9360D|nr:GNAT family N-acetyltransferase [Devosia sp.]UYO00976.1 MAG: GNAT family N-acetyltransferase [Devosia sp.]
MVRILADVPVPLEALSAFWSRAWGAPISDRYEAVLARSLGHVVAMEGERVVGFVNIAWDGGVHAFLLDTGVDPDYRRQGLATRIVGEAVGLARSRGAEWLHVDFEPHLDAFYRQCGFRPTEAGLIRLRD